MDVLGDVRVHDPGPVGVKDECLTVFVFVAAKFQGYVLGRQTQGLQCIQE